MPEAGATIWLSVTFTWQTHGCSSSKADPVKVELRGSWDWKSPVQMRRADGRAFTAEIPLKPGRYEYKYVVDGAWTVDPHRPVIRTPEGIDNNLVVIPPLQPCNELCNCLHVDCADGRMTPREGRRPARRRSLRVGVAVSQKKCAGAKVPEEVKRRGSRMHRRIALTPFEVVVCSARDVRPAAGSALCELGALALELEEEQEAEGGALPLCGPPAELERLSPVPPDEPGEESADGAAHGKRPPPGSPCSPRSVPETPALRGRRLTWYDPAELPYLVRQRLGACDPAALFDPADRHEHIQVTHGGYCATKQHPLSLYRSARCRAPVPLDRPFYFEMVLVEQRAPGGFCVGLSSPDFPLSALCGARPGSLGLYSTGDLVCGSTWRKHGRPFGLGDVVGCLARLRPAPCGGAAVAVAFFLNGEALGEADTGGPLVLRGPVRPTLTLYSHGQRARVHAAAREIACPSPALRAAAPDAVAADGRAIFGADGRPAFGPGEELEVDDAERGRARGGGPGHARRLSEAEACPADAPDLARTLSAAPTPLFYPPSTPPSVATSGQIACSL